jgi:uncharacterized membrane protein
VIRSFPLVRLLTCLALLACLVFTPQFARAMQPPTPGQSTTAQPTDTAQPAPDNAIQSPTADDTTASANTDENAEPSPYLLFLGRMHQLVVHFPIALLIVAMLIEMVALLRRQQLPTTPGLICFTLGALSAGFAAWFGWINATDADPSTTLDIHRWLGVATASLAGAMLLVALVTRLTSSKVGSRVYGLGVFLCAAIVGVTGHFGGAMIYGHTYLVEMFLPQQSLALASNTDAQSADALEPALRVIDFESHIKPIFESTCYKCHGPRRKRGDLRLDSASYAFPSDPDAWVIIPGKPDESELIRLIELPQSDSDHMPYKKSVLPRLEIERLRLWILEGAVWGDYHPSKALNQIAQADASQQETSELQAPTLSPERRNTILTALDEKGVLAFPVAENTEALDVNASLLGESFTDADLALLNGLESSVESLNLARTGITDVGLASLANYTQLRRLHLQNTQIGDDALVYVAGLSYLEYLNLYGTHVTDAGLAHLSRLPNLQKIYVWQTDVTSEGAAALADAIPGIDVDLGDYETVAVQTEEESAEAKPMPECCAAAQAEGRTCDHACCIAAAAEGEVCQTCLNGG